MVLLAVPVLFAWNNATKRLKVGCLHANETETMLEPAYSSGLERTAHPLSEIFAPVLQGHPVPLLFHRIDAAVDRVKQHLSEPQ